jgi:hypothetical protein
MAPTGTGKTMTPIALSEQKKIIFVCAARHVGLALARAAISMKKKIAFAFGCGSASDVRLHYFAAKVYSINKRTGGIGKVDNSVGDNVQIMICDIKSYLPAMYYMLAHFKAQDIILYWDEPTITMDYDKHDFHSTIRKNLKDIKVIKYNGRKGLEKGENWDRFFGDEDWSWFITNTNSGGYGTIVK